MTSDGILILRSVFQTIWTLFTSWHIPGTNTTPATWFLLLLSAGVGIRIILRVFSRDATAGSNASAPGRFFSKHGGDSVK